MKKYLIPHPGGVYRASKKSFFAGLSLLTEVCRGWSTREDCYHQGGFSLRKSRLDVFFLNVFTFVWFSLWLVKGLYKYSGFYIVNIYMIGFMFGPFTLSTGLKSGFDVGSLL